MGVQFRLCFLMFKMSYMTWFAWQNPRPILTLTGTFHWLPSWWVSVPEKMQYRSVEQQPYDILISASPCGTRTTWTIFLVCNRPGNSLLFEKNNDEHVNRWYHVVWVSMEHSVCCFPTFPPVLEKTPWFWDNPTENDSEGNAKNGSNTRSLGGHCCKDKA